MERTEDFFDAEYSLDELIADREVYQAASQEYSDLSQRLAGMRALEAVGFHVTVEITAFLEQGKMNEAFLIFLVATPPELEDSLQLIVWDEKESKKGEFSTALTRSTRDGVRWQLTRFDREGLPWGHADLGSLPEVFDTGPDGALGADQRVMQVTTVDGQTYVRDDVQRVANPVPLQSYTSFCQHVADAYDAAPNFEPNEAWRWQLLAKHVRKFYRRIARKLDIQFVEGQPYETADEMRRAVQDSGTMYISVDDNEHPLFDAETNLKFRAVHDYVVHIIPGEGGPDFSEKGEVRAYNLHRRMAPPDSWPALFTEVAAQACYANVRGEFPVQKVAVLPGFDYYNIGLSDDGVRLESYQEQAMAANPSEIRSIKKRLSR